MLQAALRLRTAIFCTKGTMTPTNSPQQGCYTGMPKVIALS